MIFKLIFFSFLIKQFRDYGWEEQDVLIVFMSLKERGLIKTMEYNSYTRIHHEDKEIKVKSFIQLQKIKEFFFMAGFNS